jgi:excisionase family DNA binding protein
MVMQTLLATRSGHRQWADVKLLLTMPEAAAALGLCRSVVYDLVLTGQIQSLKIGRARRIPVAALEAFVTQRLTEQR